MIVLALVLGGVCGVICAAIFCWRFRGRGQPFDRAGTVTVTKQGGKK